MPEIDKYFKKKRPDKRLVKKIEYAYEKFLEAQFYYGNEFLLPQKYSRKDYIKREIRKKIAEN